jgi:hypothetical protein
VVGQGGLLGLGVANGRREGQGGGGGGREKKVRDGGGKFRSTSFLNVKLLFINVRRGIFFVNFYFYVHWKVKVKFYLRGDSIL